MRQDLDDLWNYYLVDVPIKDTKKEKLIKENFLNIEKGFHSKLTQEQLEFLEEYDDAVSSIGRISERQAFVKGVMFATRFIFQALNGE